MFPGAKKRVNGSFFFFRHDENVLKLDSGDGCTTEYTTISMNILISSELHTL